LIIPLAAEDKAHKPKDLMKPFGRQPTEATLMDNYDQRIDGGASPNTGGLLAHWKPHRGG